ncbi:MAG TPA: VTT domain-containing protein [Gammaproteobacteria bacterium]|nr:VTT domain-containing protein [Gammaproteobacteria bacterium]
MLDFHAWPHYISLYGYLAVFLLSIVEGPLVTVFAAFLAAQGILDVFAVSATVITGDLVGDVLIYSVGRWFLGRLPWRLSIRSQAFRKRVGLLYADITQRAGHFLLIGKLTHAVGFAVLLAAGAARIRFSVFVLYNILGTLPKSCLLVVIGYFFGRFYQDLSAEYQTISLVALGLGMLMMVYLMHRLLAAHHRRDGLE